ncbi:MAG: MCE family protein [Phreatobacter sp.]|uniref:MlaD family protein n=1 Tax=Phreatobacter sp. TaxID=1966341 RepID=UPI001A5F0C06|nr:MlaD family protein [Phreatobacter sp.]MBL8572028.1 MCE family protein [Phreatobacter sp.]
METKANTTLIGLFTLAVLAVFGLFLWWFLRAGDNTNREDYRIVFTGPVGGLRTGANVFFNGIRKGEVRKIDIDPADPRKVVAIVAIQQGTPISSATRASLNVQLLSGIASIGLANGLGVAQPIQRPADGAPPQIGPDVPGGQDLLAGAQETMSTLNNLVRRLDETIATGQGSFQRSLQNVENFTAALNDNTDNIRNFLNQTGAAARQIAALAERLDRVTTQVESMMEGSQPGRIASILRNVDELTGGLNAQRENFADLIRDARRASGALTQTLGTVNEAVTAFDVRALNRTLGNADRVIAALDSERIGRAMANIDRFTQSLGDNSANVDQLLKNAAEVSAKLNGMADRLDSLLKGFQGEGGSNMMAEFTATARSVRTLAERLDTRTAQLTTSISGFTDRTIRDIQSLSADGRRTLTELERTLRSLERNPQRFIFGGSGVPEFNRR